MADKKTTLRELSVLVGASEILNYRFESYTNMTKPHYFYEQCVKLLGNENKSYFLNIISNDKFNNNELNIISNGFKLAKEIVIKFHLEKLESVCWFGYLTQKEEPYDITINSLKFSLKEESFILENMGLYKLINCFTGSTYKKRHIFEDYAINEYKEWFKVTWNLMLEYLKANKNIWRLIKLEKESVIEIKNNIIVMSYKNKHQSINESLPINTDLNIYKTKTTSTIREEVFAKFIKNILSNNNAYNTAKKICATTASIALANELMTNLDYSAGLPRFLRIHQEEYYYAKTTTNEVEIYKVPSISNYSNEIIIEKIEGSVPNTQANILTTIMNLKSKNKLVLRNECRFSHGQFNGTPEAKMYYERGGSLLVIYEKI